MKSFCININNVFIESCELMAFDLKITFNKEETLQNLGFKLKKVPNSDEEYIVTIPKGWDSIQNSNTVDLIIDTSECVRAKKTRECLFIYNRYTIIFNSENRDIFNSNNIFTDDIYISLYDRKLKRFLRSYFVKNDSFSHFSYINETEEYKKIISYLNEQYIKWYLPEKYWDN